MREEKERRRREKERLDAENAARLLSGASATSQSGPTSDAGSSLGGVTSEIDRVLADYGIAPVNKVITGLDNKYVV